MEAAASNLGHAVHARRRWSWWLPVAIFALSGAALLWLWQASVRAEAERLTLETRLTAEQIRLRMEDWIESRTAVVEHTGVRWTQDFLGNEQAFRTYANRMIELYKGFQALNWIDADWVIEIVVPEASNKEALGADLHDHPSPGVPRALAIAETTDRLSATGRIDLLQGGVGLTTYRAVRDENGQIIGFVNGVFRVDTLMETIAGPAVLQNRFRVALLDHEGLLATAHADDSRPSDWQGVINTPVQIANRSWSLRVAPSSDRHAGAVVEALLAAIALLLAGVLSLAVHGLVRRHFLLEESEAKYRLLVENQQDLVVKVGADGRFLFASPSYCDLFGIAESDLLGEEYMPLVHPDDREATARAVAQLENPPHTVYIEQRALTRYGWRWIAWVDTAVVDEAGTIIAIIGIGRDVTDRKRLEEQLRQSQKMQAVGQLAGGIAHDFNNILQTIVTNLEFVLDEVPTDNPIRGDLLEARTSAGRAATLVRQLLTFSRQAPMTPVNLDLDATISDALAMIRRLIGEKVALELLPGCDGTEARADPRQVEQILMNLCVNARDARCANITITTDVTVFTEEECVSRPWARPGRFVRLSVADDGHGMGERVLDKLFEPFFTTKDVGEGTGLGLATVYGIVEQHGGLIQVTSEPGAGSLFDIYLPAAEHTAPSTTSDDAGTLAETATQTILVADDDVQIRTAAKRVLERAGYRVLTASDGLEAVRIATGGHEKPAVAILDLSMPGATGLEAAERIREAAPSVRVLLSSGGNASSPEPPPEDEPILEKPYTHQQLLEAVRAALSRSASPHR